MRQKFTKNYMPGAIYYMNAIFVTIYFIID